MNTEFKPFELTPEQIEKLAEESSTYIKEIITGLQKLLVKNKQFILIALSVFASIVNSGKYIWKTIKLMIDLYVFIHNLVVDEDEFKNEISGMVSEATKPLMDILSGLKGSEMSSEDISGFSDSVEDDICN